MSSLSSIQQLPSQSNSNVLQYSTMKSQQQRQQHHIHSSDDLTENANGTNTITTKMPRPSGHCNFTTKKNGHNKVETNIVSEMNQMYRQSPFMQKRRDVIEENTCTSPKKESIYNNLGTLHIFKQFY